MGGGRGGEGGGGGGGGGGGEGWGGEGGGGGGGGGGGEEGGGGGGGEGGREGGGEGRRRRVEGWREGGMECVSQLRSASSRHVVCVCVCVAFLLPLPDCVSVSSENDRPSSLVPDVIDYNMPLTTTYLKQMKLQCMSTNEQVRTCRIQPISLSVHLLLFT